VLAGTLLADRASAVWGLLFVAATAIAWAYSRHYYAEDRPFQSEHDVLMLMTTIGMSLMAGAQDLIVFFVGLELLSIPLYALAAFRRNRAHSVEAGLKYFLLGAFAAAFFLYGAALVYTSTGTLSIAQLAQEPLRSKLASSPLALVGTALIAASLFFKVSVFPFHVWVPDVYEGSPTPVSALMATGTKAAAFAFVLNAVALLPHASAASIAWIAVLTMAVGNFGALAQTSFKRMLAYSGVAHAGTLLLAVAGEVAGDTQARGAMQAALFYMAAYVATAGGAFGLLALLEQEGEHMTNVDALRGLGRRRPYIAAAMTLFMLSLGGIPATGGFLGKYLVFAVAVRAHMVPMAVLGVLLSVVALAYYLRIVIAMWMQAPLENAPQPSKHPLVVPAAVATTLCAASVLALGLMPSWFLSRM
jgi:NADH-quinone oxidoreductase subunit N